jgi:hypothetical protein
MVQEVNNGFIKICFIIDCYWLLTFLKANVIQMVLALKDTHKSSIYGLR